MNIYNIPIGIPVELKINTSKGIDNIQAVRLSGRKFVLIKDSKLKGYSIEESYIVGWKEIWNVKNTIFDKYKLDIF